MTAFALSLRALKHPLTVLSIGLLLLNDHFLKAAIPSWFTGKLSDFAGLFFFPFLLATLLAPLARWRPVRPHWVMAFASTITSIWFALIKTLPLANHLTTVLAGALTHGFARIVLDPTDLIALPMVVLAGCLWVHLERRPITEMHTPWNYAVLGLAALATMATSPSIPPPIVQRVVISESIVYAALGQYYSGPETPPIAYSKNGGASWEYLLSPSEVVSQTLALPVAFPKTVCSEQNVAHCYRIIGNEAVEESLDGGQTWRVAWKIPWGRRKFMERSLYAAPMASNKFSEGILLGPYDLALGNVQGNELLVVAAGNEGVIVHKPTDEWQRLGVLGANPTQYAMKDIPLPWALIAYTTPETTVSLLVAVLVLIAFTLCGWTRALILGNTATKRSPGWAIRPAIVGMVISVLLISTNTSLGIGYGSAVEGGRDWQFVRFVWNVLIGIVYRWPLTLSLLLILGGGLLWAGLRVRHAASNPQHTGMVTRTAWLTAAGVFFGPALCFSLWAYGIIPVYEMALGLSVAITAFCVWKGNRALNSMTAAG